MPSKHTVLVVDDFEPTRLLIARILSEELTLEVALSDAAADAERKVRSSRFDVILLDLLMPSSSGFHLLEYIRADGPNRDTPVIVVSVLGDLQSIERCRSLGATHHVVKPVLRDSLVEVVRAHLPAAPAESITQRAQG